MLSIKQQIEHYRTKLADTDEELDLGFISREQHREKSWFYVGAIYALEQLIREIDEERNKLNQHFSVCNCD